MEKDFLALLPYACVAKADDGDCYTCAACYMAFKTVCQLHIHLACHGNGGSYYYNHHTKTAFPKFDSICTGAQTDPEYVSGRQEHIVLDDSSDTNEYNPSDIMSKGGPYDSYNSHRSKIQADGHFEERSRFQFGSEKANSNRFQGYLPPSATQPPPLSYHKNMSQTTSLSKDQLKTTTGGNQKVTTDAQGYAVVKVEVDSEDNDEDDSMNDDSNVTGNTFNFPTHDNMLNHTNTRDMMPGYFGHSYQHLYNTFMQNQEHLARHVDNKFYRIKDNMSNKNSQSKENGEDNDKLAEQSGDNAQRSSYRCDKCGKKYLNKRYFLNHVEYCGTDSERNLFPCPECGLVFITKKGIRYHMKNIHSARIISFNLSSPSDSKAQTGANEQLLYEIKTAPIKPPATSIKCSACKESVDFKDIMTHPCEEIRYKWKCVYCCSAYATEAEYREHVKVHKEKTPRKCDVCGKSFNRQYYAQHTRYCGTTAERKKYTCPESDCDVVLVTRKGLKYHIKHVHSNKKSICSICGHAVKHLQMHQERIHGDDVPTHKCSYCDRTFNNKHSLANHKSIHTAAGQNQCSYCGKMFTQKSNMRSHMRQHTNEKPYQCMYCGKNFTHKQSLKAHMANHHDYKMSD